MVDFEARPYQVKALENIYRDLQVMPEVLLSGVMGCGKTFMSVRLIQRLLNENPDMRFLILAHKRELISQFQAAFEKFTSISWRSIGICCAGLKNKTLDRQITLASIQTFVNIKEQYLGCGLFIIDECHRIDVTGDTMYRQVIEYLRLQRPNCRVLGITATPYRLGLGYCYGNKIKKGSVNLFPKLNHKIMYAELRDEGHLVPLKGIVAAHESLERDLAGIAVSGDYVINELSEIVCRSIHLETCVEAIDKYCNEYDCICVICVDINHAEKLHQLLGPIESTIIHSQLSDIERQSNMLRWERGGVRIMISVQILIEGYDLPRLKAIVMARPTLSSALYLQAVGRVLRTCDGKDHGFLLDVTDNTSRLCPSLDLDRIKVTVPKSVEAAEAKEREMWKLCPNCSAECHVALRACADCGFTWPEKECEVAKALPTMKEVIFIPSAPEWHDVIDWSIEIHTSKKSKKELGKVTYFFKETEYKTDKVYLWLCFEDNYSGFAVDKAREKWAKISADDFPLTVAEFMEADFDDPARILVDHNGKWADLKDVECDHTKSYYDPADDDVFDLKNFSLNGQSTAMAEYDEYDDEVPF